MLPQRIKKFVELFRELPGIGPRQATRLAYFLKNLGSAAIREYAETIRGLGALQTCARCFITFEDGDGRGKKLCALCADERRHHALVAIVEKETDLVSLEKTKKFRGVYLVLGELKKDATLSPEQRLRLRSLAHRFKHAPAEEFIIAMNPTAYGDLNAASIEHELKGAAKKITRLGRGIPTGGEIEFADEETLSGALDNRR